MTQSITPSNGAIEVPTQRMAPADPPTEAVRPSVPAQASAEPDLDPVPPVDAATPGTRRPQSPTRRATGRRPARRAPAGHASAGHAPAERETSERAPEHRAADREPDRTSGPRVAEPVGRGAAEALEPAARRPYITDWRPLTPATEPLPDLAATLAGVPGGLGADLDGDFTFADQQWTVDDGRWDATPIGAQLAMEQRGTGRSGARHAAG